MRRTLFRGLRTPEPGTNRRIDAGDRPEWPDRVVLAARWSGTGQRNLIDRYERKAIMYIGLGTLILIIILLILLF
jgi:hypothetical protein